MATKTQSDKQTDKQLPIVILKQMVTLISSGMGLVAALAWNSLIQDLVNNYINPLLPKGSSLISLFIYAVFITVMAVFITYYLTKAVSMIEHNRDITKLPLGPFRRLFGRIEE